MMSDPSIPIESISLQDPLAKKLQLLQTENNNLRLEREAFESNIRQYVQTISQLEDQLLDLSRKNQQLIQNNRQICSRNRKLELDLQRCSDEYKCLYNHIHAGEKRSQRDLIIKEMELNNQLNQIQYNGYSKVIIQLKDNLSRKNQDIASLNSQNTNLKQKILQSTYEYQQQIVKLKQEITRLKAQQGNTVASLKQISFEESCFEQMVNARVNCFKEQIQILEKENKKLFKQLLDLKQELHIYKSESEWLNIQIENIKSEKEVSMDFTEVRKIVNENITLKRMLQEQIYKFNTFVRNNPALMNQASELDLTATFNDIENKYQDSLLKLQKKDKEIGKIKKQISEVTKLKQAKQEQHLKFKTITTKVIEKLKNIIKQYVPCFNLYGYMDLGMEPEQCKLIQENGADIYKEHDRISSELIQKNAQISKLKARIKELESSVKDWQSNLVLQKEKCSQLKEENKKLLVSLESITQRLEEQHANQENYGQQPLQQSPRFGQEQIESPSKHNQKRHYFHDLSRQQSLTKLDSICDLALSLQKDREEMLACIRSKDAIIAEANAELKVLRSECNPKVYQFETGPSNLHISQSNHQASDEFILNAGQLLRKQAQQYQRLKEQISSMAMLYQNEMHLLQQEHRNRYSALSLKYTKLLSENNELQQRLKAIQKDYQERLQKQSDHISKKAESLQEDNGEALDLQDNFPRDEKNIISEATIQIINDLLKKYQKEFSRFSSLYQTELTKARELKRNNFEDLDRLSVEKQLHQKIETIQLILLEKEETITMLQQEVSQKQTQFNSQRERYEQNQSLSEERMAQLQTRLNHINSELQVLQKRGIDTISTAEGTSSKSISFILAALSAKNQQIISLKQDLQQKDRLNQQLSEQINDLKIKIHDQHSELQEEEFKQFKKLVQDGELSYVLEKAADLLAQRQPNEQ